MCRASVVCYAQGREALQWFGCVADCVGGGAQLPLRNSDGAAGNPQLAAEERVVTEKISQILPTVLF